MAAHRVEALSTSKKINSMAVLHTEAVIVVGMEGGCVGLLDPENLSLLSICQTNLGDIYGLATHPRRNLIATLGMDHRVTLVEVLDDLSLRILCSTSTRKVTPWNDVVAIPRNPSQSQAIAFHPSLPRLATRGSNAGVAEFEYENSGLKLLHCTRLHGLEDVTTVLYLSENSPSLVSGALGSVVFSRDGLVEDELRVADTNVHWFERLEDGDYLVATDDRMVMRASLDQRQILVTGPKFTRDDLEHVHYNSASGRAYVVGFDRNVYQVCPVTCEPQRVVFVSPFKMRWFKTLKRDPNIGYAQCFDGAVYKIDLTDGVVVESIRNTPPAIWTSCRLTENRMAFTGEGDSISICRIETNSEKRNVNLTPIGVLSKGDGSTYTKRMASSQHDVMFLAQTSGCVIRVDLEGNSAVLADMGSAVRDIACDDTGYAVYCCTENGTAYKLDGTSGDILATWRSPNEQPLWALAFNQDTDQLAVSERVGNIFILDANTFEVKCDKPAAGRVKRVKWFGNDQLVYNNTDALRRYIIDEDKTIEWVQPTGNTIEDFVWSEEFGYLVCIGYTTDIFLCDIETGEILYRGADQEDYTKGVEIVSTSDSQTYPLEILTFGRSNRIFGFRPFSDKLTAHGAVAPPLLNGWYH